MYQKEIELAIQAAKEAGAVLKMRQGISIDSEDGKDIKLSSDKKSERVIVDILQKGSNYPILSEECGLLDGENQDEYRWIVDPLDGSANYCKGLTELTCVSIALWKGTRPILGVIYRYAVNELYYGIVGEKAYCNETVIATSDVGRMEYAVLATGFPVHRNYGTENLLNFVQAVQKFKKVRMLGAAAVMGAFVASGYVDAYWEDHIMLWDIAAAAAIVQAAGGESVIQHLEKNMCVCKLFANQMLMEDFNAQGL